jgi:hypothetical protein
MVVKILTNDGDNDFSMIIHTKMMKNDNTNNIYYDGG